jgi:hypothetical protein
VSAVREREDVDEDIMPWIPTDATKHTKAADAPAKRVQWSRVANKVLRETGDEGKAIRIANAAVKKSGK